VKLNYRLTGTSGVEWQAVGDDGEPLGPWRKTQYEARQDFVQIMDEQETE
jgi:hypothetical protein